MSFARPGGKLLAARLAAPNLAAPNLAAPNSAGGYLASAKASSILCAPVFPGCVRPKFPCCL